jgi:glyoxylase-like metal-dependent hydrolase (beta-lactamase superfamily II)/rhodanese-related sulfurtransferase
MTDRPAPDVDEIPASEFERELRDGADVVVIDTRARDVFAEWHVETGGARLLNVPEGELVADPDGTMAGIPANARLRVICNAGNASRRVAAALEGHARETRSVRDGLVGWSRVLQRDEVPVAAPFTVIQFRREARGCLSYLVASGGEALVVDPAPDVEAYLEEAAARGVRIVRVFDTHVHADHLSGARELARRTNAVLHMSAAALARGVRYADEVVPVRDGDDLTLGDASVRVVGLPGHTSDMTGLMIGDGALIGGDSLFADGVARPDLENGDEGAPSAARRLHRTLRQRVAPLAEATLLLPCHYPGGRRDGALAPTLHEVREAVPELALDEDAFVEQVLSAMPPRPENYLAIIGVNLGELPGDEAARLEIGANNCAANPDWVPDTP